MTTVSLDCCRRRLTGIEHEANNPLCKNFQVLEETHRLGTGHISRAYALEELLENVMPSEEE